MSFPERLVALRKERGLSQTALGERIGVHLTQVQRYESGSSQPTLDVIRRMAQALVVSADVLVFDETERGPQDDDMKLIFEAVDRFSPEEKATTREVLQALVARYQGGRRDGSRAASKAKAGKTATPPEHLD